ncbi:hypothetical protein TNCT_602341 [Trichonephila clavata]|uniref:Uncharacterized protein n=1 Tax=Trichonephila clavata TaxID=2740835 RepID=A0A8X6HVS8_TRICU|nr:hypothetical protein TNCT_602341 [Trichonephila clavata]
MATNPMFKSSAYLLYYYQCLNLDNYTHTKAKEYPYFHSLQSSGRFLKFYKWQIYLEIAGNLSKGFLCWLMFIGEMIPKTYTKLSLLPRF